MPTVTGMTAARTQELLDAKPSQTQVDQIAEGVNIRAVGAAAGSGLKQNRATYGTYDQATVASFVGNRQANPTTEVDGTTDPSIAQGGSVAVNITNDARPPTVQAASGAIFTATSVTAAWVGPIAEVLPNMLVQAGPSGPFAFVTSVVGNQINVAGWRLNGAVVATPANNLGCYVNRIRKLWGLNLNAVKLGAENAGVGMSIAMAEFGLLTNEDTAGGGLGFGTVHQWGIDVTTLDSVGKGTAAIVARGKWGYGVSVSGALVNAFVAHKELNYTAGVQMAAAFKDELSMSLVSFGANRDNAAGWAFATRRSGDAFPRWARDRDGVPYSGDGALAPEPGGPIRALTVNSTTPSVANGGERGMFKSVNGQNTAITDFTGGTEGQIVEVFILDSFTQFIHGSNFQLQGNINYTPVISSMIAFRRILAGWREIHRSTR